MRKTMALVAFGALLASHLVACGEEREQGFVPYQLGQALVIGPEKGGTEAALEEACEAEAGEAPSSGACQTAVEECGREAFAEVVLDESRELLDVVCYPGNARVKEIGTEAVVSAEAGNHTVLVLDDVDDGADVTGDVTLTGNGAVVWGSGADVSVIGGDLNVDKNNAVLRGVRIQGDVTISKNNATLAFCEIDGNLTILGNNATVAECVVHGEVSIEGNNAVFVRNELGSETSLSGKNLSCNANVVLEQPAAESESDASPGNDTEGDAGSDAPAEPRPVTCSNR